MHFRLDLSVGASTMNPDLTAPKEQSDLGPYCLQYWHPKCISRQEQTIIAVNEGKKFKQ